MVIAPASMETAMTRKATFPAALLLGAACVLISTAASAAPPSWRDCFDSGQVADWVAGGDQTVYLRVNASDYYRIDLPTPIRQLRSRSLKLVVGSRDGRICGVNDLDLGLSLSATQTLSLRAARLTRLSAEDVTAIGLENLPGQYYRRH